jgi:hypothetical protein
MDLMNDSDMGVHLNAGVRIVELKEIIDDMTVDL